MALATVRMLSDGHQRVLLANHLALKHGLTIVRDILAKKDGPLHSPLGMTTDELYKLTLQHTPSEEFYNPHLKAGAPFPPMPPPRSKGKKKEPPPAPPNPEHPIRSKVFLKTIVLQYLLGTQEIVKTRTERILDSTTISKTNKKGKRVPVYDTDVGQVKHAVWVWKSVDAVESGTAKRPPRPPPLLIEPFGAKVGVGEDISHLNLRRQNARRADERRYLKMLKVSVSGAELGRLSKVPRKSRQEQDWEEKRSVEREEGKLRRDGKDTKKS